MFNQHLGQLRERRFPQPIQQKIEARMVEVFFQVLLDVYQKIDKVNENGKQLMRLDVIELSKMIESQGVPTYSSVSRANLDLYLSMWFFRDPKDLEKNILANQVGPP